MVNFDTEGLHASTAVSMLIDSLVLSKTKFLKH